MQHNYRLPVVIAILSLVTLFGFLSISKYIAYNITISEPIGWYWLNQADKVAVGKLYTIKLDDRYMQLLRRLGYSSDSVTLLKRVVAEAGDKVEVTADGVVVNAKLLPNSKAVAVFKGVLLNPLPIGFKYKLKNNEYFMLGETPHSFDSRYFGVIQQTAIINNAQLIVKG